MMSYLHLERKALFLSRLSRREEAIESALISLAGFRWNWSAWTLLGSCIGDGEEVVPLPLITALRSHFSQLSSLLQLLPLIPDHPLIHFFQIKTLNELHNPSEHELQLCDRLLGHEFFPNSLWIMSLRACVLYHLHGTSILLFFFIPHLVHLFTRFWPSWSSV
jgi:anaphase-promoting complex subunit 8